ncbi:LysR family transcriptional regulator [Pontibacterium granulatum]|uniref:LysR family transcriptional regulator n=1 Tax=Pontibacterium granulatum TaxID=2036029 RepID=UPI00249C167A|nr:LysR family transcriptional regulator [Pontibacterium granulatum]MDI3324549.1 LysR family transcriptional regulator [Pontibacterium granulatum]
MSLKAEYLRALIATDRNGSLSAAAGELGITVSSVSYAIRQLEDNLGECLLNRDNYRVSLTEAGRVAVEHGAEILRLQSSLEAEVHHIASGWERELTIAFTNMLRSDALYDWLAQFYQLNSGTRVRIIREVYSGTWDALYDKRADLVIGAVGRPPHEVDVSYVPMGRRQLYLAMHAKHTLAELPEPLSMEQVAVHRLVDAGDSSRLIRRASSDGVFISQDQLTVPDLFAQKEAILSGIAVGFMPLHLIEDEINQGRLLVREVENRECSVELYACWRRSSRGRALTWFTERLQKNGNRQQFI